MHVRKIRISGATGSGKSYAAKKMSRILNIPYYEIDIDVYFDPQDTHYHKIRPEKERKRILHALCMKKKWILDGGYSSEWAAEAFEKAELIIVIWPPVWKRWKNILSRTLKGESKKKQTLLSSAKLLRQTWNWKHKRHKIMRYPEKTVEFTNADAAIAWVKKELV